MIKAKEIRIGNYITEVTAFDGFYASVVSIGVDTCIYGVGYTALFDKLAPIPLTEKWLLDFGFIKSKDNYGNTYHILDSNGFECIFTISHWNRVDKSSKWYNKWNTKGLLKGNRLQYVHQLQNLYFALTGEELTLKK
jgi:hypothetical protein